MKRGKVISILRFFSTIDKEIQMNNATIEDLNDRYYITLGAQNIDGLPHGKGGVSKPVENMVANVPDYVRKKIEGKKRRNKRLEEVGAAIGQELDRLNFYEKAVILWFYLDGATWEQISGRMNYSPRQCRNLRDKALDRLASRFSANKAIFTFKFPEN